MSRYGQSSACDNMNHRRSNAPVSHCPKCGGVVNAQIPAKRCSESDHDAVRRDREVFCVDCGTQVTDAH